MMREASKGPDKPKNPLPFQPPEGYFEADAATQAPIEQDFSESLLHHYFSSTNRVVVDPDPPKIYRATPQGLSPLPESQIKIFRVEPKATVGPDGKGKIHTLLFNVHTGGKIPFGKLMDMFTQLIKVKDAHGEMATKGEAFAILQDGMSVTFMVYGDSTLNCMSPGKGGMKFTQCPV